MIDSPEIKEIKEIEENKSCDLQTLISRAEAAEENRKFTIAANHYFTILSRHFTILSKSTDLLKNLVDKFIFTIILIPVSLQRQRMLNFVLKNESLDVFDYKHFLDKLHHFQLIKEYELIKIISNCPSKLIDLNSGNSFERAIFEHNLISLSKVYDNINFMTLERFLEMNIDKILNYTFRMIIDKKINAKIDEINKFIFFVPESTTSLSFDKQIHNFSLQVVQLSEYIKSKQ